MSTEDEQLKQMAEAFDKFLGQFRAFSGVAIVLVLVLIGFSSFYTVEPDDIETQERTTAHPPHSGRTQHRHARNTEIRSNPVGTNIFSCQSDPQRPAPRATQLDHRATQSQTPASHR